MDLMPFPVVRLVRLALRADCVSEFIAYFEAIRKDIAGFDGCLQLEFYRDNEHPGVVYTLSRWSSAEHLEKYRQSDLFKTNWAHVSRWFDDKPQAFTLVPQT